MSEGCPSAPEPFNVDTSYVERIGAAVTVDHGSFGSRHAVELNMLNRHGDTSIRHFDPHPWRRRDLAMNFEMSPKLSS
jgi:hypothetical protein